VQKLCHIEVITGQFFAGFSVRVCIVDRHIVASLKPTVWLLSRVNTFILMNWGKGINL